MKPRSKFCSLNPNVYFLSRWLFLLLVFKRKKIYLKRWLAFEKKKLTFYRHLHAEVLPPFCLVCVKKSSIFCFQTQQLQSRSPDRIRGDVEGQEVGPETVLPGVGKKHQALRQRQRIYPQIPGKSTDEKGLLPGEKPLVYLCVFKMLVERSSHFLFLPG